MAKWARSTVWFTPLFCCTLIELLELTEGLTPGSWQSPSADTPMSASMVMPDHTWDGPAQ